MFTLWMQMQDILFQGFVEAMFISIRFIDFIDKEFDKNFFVSLRLIFLVY